MIERKYHSLNTRQISSYTNALPNFTGSLHLKALDFMSTLSKFSSNCYLNTCHYIEWSVKSDLMASLGRHISNSSSK